MNQEERRQHCFELARNNNGKRFKTIKEALRFFGYSEKSNISDTFANAHIRIDERNKSGWKIVANINTLAGTNCVSYIVYDMYLKRTPWWKLNESDHKYILEEKLK